VRRSVAALASLLCLLCFSSRVRADDTCTADAFRLLDRIGKKCSAQLQDLTGATWYTVLTQPRGNAVGADGKLSYEPDIIHGLRALKKQVDADVANKEIDPAWARWFVQRLDALGPEGQNVADLEPAAGVDECACAIFGGNQGPMMCHVLEGQAAMQEAATCPKQRVVGKPRALARYYTYLTAATQGIRALGSLARRAQHIALRGAISKWRNLLVNGYVQFPWELWINAARYEDRPLGRPYTVKSLWPKRLQYVALHPVVAVGFQGFRKDAQYSAQAVAVLGAEIFGLLGYTKSFSHYFGASALVSVDNLNFNVPRLGALVHLTRFVHVGYAAALNRKDATLMMSFDLFGWVQRLSGLAGTELDGPAAGE
jgi:hypothetical protein